MHIDTHTPQALLDDTLDPSLGAQAICRAHGISLAEVIEFLRAPNVQQLTEARHLLCESRTRLLALDIAPRAMQALGHTTVANEESRLLNEAIRNSASELLAIARQSRLINHQQEPPVPPQAPERSVRFRR